MAGLESGRGGKKSLLIARFHRADPRLDEGDVVFGQAVFLVKHLVGPRAVPRLLRYPRVRRASRVLRDFAERDEEPEELRAQVAIEAVCRLFRVDMKEQVRLRTDRRRTSDETRAEYRCRTSAPLTVGLRNHHLPRVNELSALVNVLTGDPAD